MPVALVACILALATACGDTRPAPAEPTLVDIGRGLVQAKPCLVCHTTDGSPAAAPTFRGLAGSDVRLTDGSVVTANDDYLMRSILDPSAQTVAGFQHGLMAKLVPPGSITPRQASAIVAYLHTLSTENTSHR